MPKRSVRRPSTRVDLRDHRAPSTARARSSRATSGPLRRLEAAWRATVRRAFGRFGRFARFGRTARIDRHVVRKVDLRAPAARSLRRGVHASTGGVRAATRGWRSHLRWLQAPGRSLRALPSRLRWRLPNLAPTRLRSGLTGWPARLAGGGRSLARRATAPFTRLPRSVVWAVGFGVLALVAVAYLGQGMIREAIARSQVTRAARYVFVGEAELDRLRGVEAVVGESYIWPIELVGRVTSCFGPRSLTGALAHHQGVDIAAPIGTPVVASKTGVVKHHWISTSATGYGTRVLLVHPDGMHTLYAHLLPRLQLTVGQTVAQGDVVGLSGNTGFSTGPHLHFEILDDKGRAHDPAQYLTTRLDAPIFREEDDLCWPKGVLAWQR